MNQRFSTLTWWHGFFALAIGMVLSADGSAQQPYDPYGSFYQSRPLNRGIETVNPYIQRARVSPMVNLSQFNRGGTTPGITYFGVVRPSRQLADQAQLQQNALRQLSQDQSVFRQEQQGESVTGHATFFLNYSTYYPGFGRGR